METQIENTIYGPVENTIYGPVSSPEFQSQQSTEFADGGMSINQLMNLPTSGKLTEDVLCKLVEAFKKDCTIEQACRHAMIGDRTYYYWQKRSKEFAEKMASARDVIAVTARENIAKAISGTPLLDDEGKPVPGEWLRKPSVEDSWKWLERREKSLYSPRTEVTGEGGQSINITLGGEEF